jgi:hypothetical protein
MGRTRRAELEIQTLAREVVGMRHDWNPSPVEKVAKEMGVTSLLGSHSFHSDIWRMYEELSREYGGQVSRWPSFLRFHCKEAWIREKTSASLRMGTDCYFGWAGAKFIEEERWKKRNNAGRSHGQDKILICGSFDLDFDTIELANSYKGKPVLCLHIKGRYGLLAELDGSSQMYRRVGVYRHATGKYEIDAWEPMTVTLI